jgi:hypothetical protein
MQRHENLRRSGPVPMCIDQARTRLDILLGNLKQKRPDVRVQVRGVRSRPKGLVRPPEASLHRLKPLRRRNVIARDAVPGRGVQLAFKAALLTWSNLEREQAQVLNHADQYILSPLTHTRTHVSDEQGLGAQAAPSLNLGDDPGDLGQPAHECIGLRPGPGKVARVEPCGRTLGEDVGLGQYLDAMRRMPARQRDQALLLGRCAEWEEPVATVGEGPALLVTQRAPGQEGLLWKARWCHGGCAAHERPAPAV